MLGVGEEVPPTAGLALLPQHLVHKLVHLLPLPVVPGVVVAPVHLADVVKVHCGTQLEQQLDQGVGTVDEDFFR